jgi:hypothetical protein
MKRFHLRRIGSDLVQKITILVHQITQQLSAPPPNCKTFPGDGAAIFFSSLPEPFFGSIVDLRAWV